MSARQAVVAAALGEVGNSDRSVYDAVSYEPGAVTNRYWCVSFALWCLHQAGLTTFRFGEANPFGAGFVYPLGLEQIPPESAAAGDIAYFEHLQHHAIVVSAPVFGTLPVVNGNGNGGAVTTSSPDLGRVSAVYSIQSLIDESGALPPSSSSRAPVGPLLAGLGLLGVVVGSSLMARRR